MYFLWWSKNILPIIHLLLKIISTLPFCQKHVACTFACGRNDSTPLFWLLPWLPVPVPCCPTVLSPPPPWDGSPGFARLLYLFGFIYRFRYNWLISHSYLVSGPTSSWSRVRYFYIAARASLSSTFKHF